MKTNTNHNISSTFSINPVASSERYNSIDIIRGVALLGILMINIEIFVQPFEILLNPSLSGDFTGSNYNIWLMKEVVFTSKMWSLFSILFGAGAYLLITRAENQGRAAGIADIYYRRLMWLLLFGVIHAYLIWSGDILYSYAICGLFLYPLRKLSVRGMFAAVFILLFISFLLAYLKYRDHVSLYDQVVEIEAIKESGEEISDGQQAILEEWDLENILFNPDKGTLQKNIEIMSSGTYLEIIKSEKKIVRAMHTEYFYPMLFFLNLLMMMLGMALVKSKVLLAKLRSRTYILMMIFGYIIGCIIAVFRIQDLIDHNFGLISLYRMMMIIERLAIVSGHIGLICLFCKSNMFSWLKISLAAVGRMAFSNYIFTSLFCTFLFYGYGIGLYGTMDRTEQLWIVGAAWLFQLIGSPIWLKYFRFGPLEWVWRSLTYWKRQPMRV